MNSHTLRHWKHFMAATSVWLVMTGPLAAQFPNFPSVKDYGAVGDGVTDDLPAFEEAMTSSLLTNSTVYAVRGIVVVPPGTYFLNGTLVLNNSVHLIGGSTGQPGGNWASTLKFPADTAGIRIVKGATGQQGADGTIIEGICLLGGGGSSGSAHGLDVQARIRLRDSSIIGFAGNGVHISADVHRAEKSNANCWMLDTVYITGNGGHGLFTDGGDSNAGLARSVESTNNGGWGIFDSSFLGNTYVGCSVAGNTQGAYQTDNANARNVFLGCFSENGQPVSSIRRPSIVIGGYHGAGVAGDGYAFIHGENPSVSAANPISTANLVVGRGTSGEMIALSSTGNPPYRLKYTTGKWLLDFANFGAAKHLELYNRAATQRNLSTKDGGLGFPVGFFGGGMKFRGDAKAPPTTDTWLQGDFLYNLSPVKGDYIGWVCVAGGTPGIWKKFGPIEP